MMTISSIENEFDENFHWSVTLENRRRIKSFYRQKIKEREREIIDIIIDWEKEFDN